MIHSFYSGVSTNVHRVYDKTKNQQKAITQVEECPLLNTAS